MSDLLDLAAAVDPQVALVVFLVILDMWAAGQVVFSRAALREKTLWVGVILLCPIIGCVFWFVFGPKWTTSTH